MKTLLQFTPRLVMAVLLILLFCSNLMANEPSVNTAPVQNVKEVIGGFILMLLLILLPLLKKRNSIVSK